mmetsp:Transcript_453/g.1129  ORF Transcript_453/g.1129 Transcript_453/m.1129 type:complete len:203 (+) Transcript_453:1306-1914(+)
MVLARLKLQALPCGAGSGQVALETPIRLLITAQFLGQLVLLLHHLLHLPLQGVALRADLVQVALHARGIRLALGQLLESLVAEGLETMALRALALQSRPQLPKLPRSGSFATRRRGRNTGAPSCWGRRCCRCGRHNTAATAPASLRLRAVETLQAVEGRRPAWHGCGSGRLRLRRLCRLGAGGLLFTNQFGLRRLWGRRALP